MALPVFLSTRDKARRRLWDIDMSLIHAIAGDEVNRVANDHGRTSRQIVRKHPQFANHVEFPDDVGGPAFALRAGTNQFATIVHVIKPLAFDDGRRADSLVRPIVDTAGGELVVNRLPEEFAVRFTEAHQHALVAGDLGVARIVVVGADEDLAIGHDRTAIGLRAEIHFEDGAVVLRPTSRRSGDE